MSIAFYHIFIKSYHTKAKRKAASNAYQSLDVALSFASMRFTVSEVIGILMFILTLLKNIISFFAFFVNTKKEKRPLSEPLSPPKMQERI